MTREEGWIVSTKLQVLIEDFTDAWQPFVHDPKLANEEKMDRHVRVHGKECANHMEFYKR